MLESMVFHSQLSSIMETLVASAVTEINKLMTDYCAVLQSELSRERHKNDILTDTLETLRNNVQQKSTFDSGEKSALARPEVLRDITQIGDKGAGPQVHFEQGFPQSGGSGRSGGSSTLTEPSRELDEITSKRRVCKMEADAIMDKIAPEEISVTEEQEISGRARSSSSPLVSQQQFPAAPNTASRTEWQFRRPPTERNHELEEDTSVNISCSLVKFNVEDFHIKAEPFSPTFETSSLDEKMSSESGLKDGQTCSDYGEFSLESTLFDVPGSGANSCLLPVNNVQSSAVERHDSSLMRQNVTDYNMLSNRGNQSEPGRDGHCNEASSRGIGASQTMKYICQYCGKGFPFLSKYKIHQLTHTRERTQHCAQCGKSFIRKSHLRRHELLHTGLRPFSCQLCGRRFARSSSLRTHTKTHFVLQES